jgi:hypothetical protein
MMVVNVSPSESDIQETLSSLRFAQQVNKTELGKAKKNVREAPSQQANAGMNNRGRNHSQ